MKRTTICIIGMGPRGLSILERIGAIARSARQRLDLVVIDPGDCGPGVHSPHQPQHLMINTVASQVTIFPFRDAVHAAPAMPTPSLTEWARAQGYRRCGEQYRQCGASAPGSAAIGDADYLPRQLLGRYLMWAYAQIAAALPAGVTLTHLRQRACDMSVLADGRSSIELDNGALLVSDFVFLATGHGRNRPDAQEQALGRFAAHNARRNPRLAYVRHPYPLEGLDAIVPGARVAVQGMGLSAHDVIAQLTAGRGGRFTGVEGSLRYLASGREPTLLLFSRNGVPAAARGLNQKGINGRPAARFFTRQAIAALREHALAARGSGQLDFELEVLPLLMREMGVAYRRAMPDGARADDDCALSETERAALEGLLFPLRGRRFADPAAFAGFFTDYLRSDLREARRGNVGSPLKAAADVLRDARAVLQDMLEHGGLAPDSHRLFMGLFNPAINRMTFGPPRQRNEQLLALIEAGVVELAAGPGPALSTDEQHARFVLRTSFPGHTVEQHADVLVNARLDAFSPLDDDAALTANLLERGLVRPFQNGNYHPGGIDIDQACHPLTRGGAPLRTVWAVGYLVEGAHYYTHALPRPLMHSRQVLDAERCVSDMFAAITARNTARQEGPSAVQVADDETLSLD